MKHEYVDGVCKRCGQTPWVGEEYHEFFDRLFGRTKECLTDEGLKEQQIYYDVIRRL